MKSPSPHPSGQLVPLYTESAIAAVFTWRRGCARALYHTPAWVDRIAPWADFLRSKNELVQLMEPEALLRRFPQATEGLFLETSRPYPSAPSYPEVLLCQREGRPLLFVDGIDDFALGELATRAVPAGFYDWILSENQSPPDHRAYAAADGLLERVRVRRAGSLRHIVKDMHTHFLTVGLSGHNGRALDKLKPPRAPGRPVALIWTGEKPCLYPHELSVRFDGTPASADLLFRILQAAQVGLK